MAYIVIELGAANNNTQKANGNTWIVKGDHNIKKVIIKTATQTSISHLTVVESGALTDVGELLVGSKVKAKAKEFGLTGYLLVQKANMIAIYSDSGAYYGFVLAPNGPRDVEYTFADGLLVIDPKFFFDTEGNLKANNKAVVHINGDTYRIFMR